MLILDRIYIIILPTLDSSGQMNPLQASPNLFGQDKLDNNRRARRTYWPGKKLTKLASPNWMERDMTLLGWWA